MPSTSSREGRIWPIWKVDPTSKLMLYHIVGARNKFFLQNHTPTIPLSCHQEKLIRYISQKKTTPFIKKPLFCQNDQNERLLNPKNWDNCTS